MPDRDGWLLPLLAAALCAGAMAVLVTGIALLLGTTGHDWYAAAKLTFVETTIALGFDAYGAVDYRTADGAAVTVERYRMAYVMVEPWRARRLIFSLIVDRGVLGACTGLALYVLWLGARAAAALSRRFRGGVRRAFVEPRPRSGFAGPVRHPDAWSEGELIAALARRGGRLGVLLAPAAEVERLAGSHGGAAGPPTAPSAQADRAPAPPAQQAAKQAAGTRSKPGLPERAPDVSPAAAAADDGAHNADARSSARRRPRRYERWA